MPPPLVFQSIISGQFDPRNVDKLVAWFKADQAITSVTGFTGTGTVAQTTTTITGIGTAFLSEVVVGDKVSGSGFNETVTGIASNTSLTVDTSGTVGAGASFTITPQAGVTDRVTQWTDQSGLAHHFTQATLSKSGILANSVLNGRPVIRFDAANDTMSVSTFSLAQPIQVFVVGKYDQAFSATAIILDGSSGNNSLRFSRTASGTMGISAGTGLTTTGNTPEVFHIYSLEFSGASSAIRVDENSITASGNAGTASPGGLVINSTPAGTTSFGGVDISEIIIYNSILPSSDRLRVENYLSKKYAIALTS